ncbi:MAG: hypothetical protein LBM06_04700 [Prevotellaceae bacterium]|jgi:hypothetical protein|nr:hypothetical protein [Prevotellaceae bacterium]
MTIDQIYREVRLDSYELRQYTNMMVHRFMGDLAKARTPLLGRESVLYHSIKKRDYKTRQGNTWKVCLIDTTPTTDKVGATVISYLTIPFPHGYDYIVLSWMGGLIIKHYTHHFSQRYRERHVDALKLNIGSLPPPVHFAMKHQPYSSKPNRYSTPDYAKKMGTEHPRGWWLSPYGIFLVECYYEYKTFKYITYIDNTTLNYKQQQLLEEERAYNTYTDCYEAYFKACDEEFTDVRLLEEMTDLYRKLPPVNHLRKVLERYYQRTFPPEMLNDPTFVKAKKELVDGCGEVLKPIGELIDELMETNEEYKRKQWYTLTDGVIGRPEINP